MAETVPQLPKPATCFTTMGCEVTPATYQLGMSPVEYTDMAGEAEETGKAAIAARLSPALSPSYCRGMQPPVLRARIAVTYSPPSTRRSQRLFWKLMDEAWAS